MGLGTWTASDPICEISDNRLAFTKNDEEPNGIKLSPNIRCINMLRVSQHEVRSSVRAMPAT
jgi:hypothetical protein